MRNSGLPIITVPRLHQSKGNIERKLRAWRVEKCITPVGADTAFTSAGPQSTQYHGGLYRAENGNMRNFGPTNPQGTAFPPKQWSHEKEATGMESSKIITLVGADSVLTSAGSQSAPFHMGLYRTQNGNVRKFGPTNPHGTAFAPNQS